MTITLYTQILSGNLGDGWNDNNEAADALADYTERTWRADLAELLDEGHEVEIEIDVQKDTGGYSHSVRVEADTFEMVERVEGLLTDEGTIWERFCAAEEAAEYWSEEETK